MASADETIAALQEAVAREKATSKENLRKVMAMAKEKRFAEEQLRTTVQEKQTSWMRHYCSEAA